MTLFLSEAGLRKEWDIVANPIRSKGPGDLLLADSDPEFAASPAC